MIQAAIAKACGEGFSEPVRDPIWKHVYLDPAMLAITKSPEFFKLTRIRQLGPTYLAYPGATHTRFSHSFGVYHLARRMLLSLAERCDLSFVSETGARSFLVAALCHDLGHFPFAHSLKDLPLAKHETLTARILSGELAPLVRAAGADPGFASAIVDPAPDGVMADGVMADGAIPDGAELRLYRSMLSGVLDPDKLDYLNRDAFFCGIPYGTQDVDFAFQHLRADPQGRLAIDFRGVMSVEAILFSKYLMYRSVYWHRTVRAATAMVKKSVRSGMASGEIAPERLYGLDDESFIAFLEEAGFPEAQHARSAFRGCVYGTAFEAPFDAARHNAGALERIERELALELERLSGRPVAVIVDLPESISFESDMPVSDNGSAALSFSESGTVFTRRVVEGFVHSLRTLRVFVDRPLSRVETEAVADRLGAT